MVIKKWERGAWREGGEGERERESFHMSGE